MSTRSMSVAGSFYPAQHNEINQMIDHFNRILSAHPEAIAKFESLHGRAFIVPHAGWIYSGFTANAAYRVLAKANPETVVVIGPSHRVGFDGISIADTDSYQTPLGELSVNQSLVSRLRERFAIPYLPQAHHEHSTEVQVPFIKHYCPDVKIVELVYAYADPSRIVPIIDEVLNDPKAVIVISTDLSHYYSLEQANRLDAICLEAIRNEDAKTLHQGCEACGAIGVEAMLQVARTRGMGSVLLDYRTSADASGDTARVVGYASAVFQEKVR